MRGRWVAATISVMLTLANAALAQSPSRQAAALSFISQSPILTSTPIARRLAKETEPSYAELSEAVRDMAICGDIDSLLSKLRIRMVLEKAPKGDFYTARQILVYHGFNRPDFSLEQRRNIFPLDTFTVVESTLSDSSAVQKALQKCVARLDDLRPMLTSYRIDKGRRQQCIEAFERNVFPELRETRGATAFELFAIYPDGNPLTEIIERPKKVTMEFVVQQPRSRIDVKPTSKGDLSELGVDFKTERSRESFWERWNLKGGCPTEAEK